MDTYHDCLRRLLGARKASARINHHLANIMAIYADKHPQFARHVGTVLMVGENTANLVDLLEGHLKSI